MDTHAKLLAAAEHLFDHHGFSATGMDRLADAAGMSSRTLYKHGGSKSELILAVLAERDRRFFASIRIDTMDGLFDALEHWLRADGARGCLFLRALGDLGADSPAVQQAVTAHKTRTAALIGRIAATQARADKAQELAEHLILLFEGATAAAVYRGIDAIASARRAAAALTSLARA